MDKNRRSYDDLVSDLYSLTLNDKWDELVLSVREYLQCAFVAIGLFTKHGKGKRRCAIVSQDQDLSFAAALDQFQDCGNPFDQIAVSKGVKPIRTLFELAEDRYGNSVDYLEMLNRFNFGDVVRCTLIDRRNYIIVLNAYRSYDQPVWSADDLALLEAMRRHLNNALQCLVTGLETKGTFGDLINLVIAENPFCVLDNNDNVISKFKWDHFRKLSIYDVPTFQKSQLKLSKKTSIIKDNCHLNLSRIQGDRGRFFAIGPISGDQGGLTLFEAQSEIESADAIFWEGISTLSKRECDFLELYLNGLNELAIAGKSGVSVNTVKFHRKNIFAKLGVSSSRELILHSKRHL